MIYSINMIFMNQSEFIDKFSMKSNKQVLNPSNIIKKRLSINQSLSLLIENYKRMKRLTKKNKESDFIRLISSVDDEKNHNNQN